MDLEKRVQEKKYFTSTTEEGVFWGSQYFELKEIYKEIIDESITWITNNFTNKELKNEYLNGLEKITFFEGDREEVKEKLRTYLIFENIGKFLKDNKIGILMQFREKNVEMVKAKD